MDNKTINKNKFYTIKGTGRAHFYKIITIDTPSNKAYMKGINNDDAGYYEIDRLRVFSDKYAADYIKWAKGVVKELEKMYPKLLK